MFVGFPVILAFLALLACTAAVPASSPPDGSSAVPLTFKVKNVGDSPVSLEHGGLPSASYITWTDGGKEYTGPVTLKRPAIPNDFVVVRPDGSKVWDLLCEAGAIAGAGMTTTLEPGQELIFMDEWKQWDNQGEAVPPGDYLIYGVFDTHPELATGPTKVTIAP
jgi:hypothetical protein